MKCFEASADYAGRPFTRRENFGIILDYSNSQPLPPPGPIQIYAKIQQREPPFLLIWINLTYCRVSVRARLLRYFSRRVP